MTRVLVEALPPHLTYLEWDLGPQGQVETDAVAALLLLPSLEHLSLMFEKSGFLEVVGPYLEGSSLRSLKILKNGSDEGGIKEILPYLGSLYRVDLSDNQSQVSDDDAEIIASVLSDPCCRIHELDLRFTRIGQRGMRALANSLKMNQSLRRFKAHGHDPSNDCYGSYFVEALQTNTTLIQLSCDACEQDACLIQYYLQLNKAGRDNLNQNIRLPPGVWPRLLAEHSHFPDVLYFFLQEVPTLYCTRIYR